MIKNLVCWHPCPLSKFRLLSPITQKIDFFILSGKLKEEPKEFKISGRNNCQEQIFHVQQMVRSNWFILTDLCLELLSRWRTPNLKLEIYIYWPFLCLALPVCSPFTIKFFPHTWWVIIRQPVWHLHRICSMKYHIEVKPEELVRMSFYFLR